MVHDAEEIDGRVGVWMELIEGETLEDEVRNGSTLDAEAAAEVGVALCDALEKVHAVGIVHGDIKAQNVMRSDDGRIVLMDFGAARFRDPRKEESGTRTGTPVYMAPELFKYRGAKLVEPTVQSDIYAVGVLLFYLVTGKHPVKGRDVEDFRNAHESGEQMLLLADVRPELPAAFVQVVEQALARTPTQRWLSVTEMEGELEALAPATIQPVRLKRLVQAVAVTSGVFFTMLVVGFVATRAFEVFLSIPRRFQDGLPGYLVTGREAMVPMVATAAVVSFLIALTMFLAWVAQALWSGRSPSDFASEKTPWDLLRPLPGNPTLSASLVCLVGVACWVGISVWSANIFIALAAISELPNTTADVSVLSPDASSYHKTHLEYSVYLSVFLGAILGLWFPSWERRIQDVRTVRVMKLATYVVILGSLAAAVVPRRVLWDEFEIVRYGEEEAFVIGSNDEELFLFNPNESDRTHWSTPRSDPDLVETGVARKLFQ